MSKRKSADVEESLQTAINQAKKRITERVAETAKKKEAERAIVIEHLTRAKQILRDCHTRLSMLDDGDGLNYEAIDAAEAVCNAAMAPRTPENKTYEKRLYSKAADNPLVDPDVIAYREARQRDSKARLAVRAAVQEALVDPTPDREFVLVKQLMEDVQREWKRYQHLGGVTGKMFK